MEKYDYILPIGESCITSYNLRKRNLQQAAYPFDWLMDFKLDKFVYYHTTQYKDFLLKENLEEYLDIPPTSNAHYKDIKTNILFVHCFKKNACLSDFDEVKTIFWRRINRFCRHFYKAKRVLLVYTSKSDNYSDEELKKMHAILASHKKKGRLELLYIVNVQQPNIYIYIRLSPEITKVTMSYSNDNFIPGQGGGEYWKGVQPLWDTLLNNYGLTTKFYKVFFKFLACFVPNKKLRKRIRRL